MTGATVRPSDFRAQATWRYLRILMLFIALGATVADTIGQPVSTVRGRLVRQSGPPAAGVPVTVLHPMRGRSGAAYSAPDGMYYLHGIPPGQYTLEVWVFPQQRPWIFQINVYPQPTNDIAPISIPG